MRRMFSLEQLKGIADNRVKTLVEGGSLENAKPIYFHPIRFDIVGSTSGQQIRVKSGSIMILNNSNTPLDTYDKLRAYLYNSGDNIDILCSIDFYDGTAYAGQILGMSAIESSITIYFTTDGLSINTGGTLGSSEMVILSDTVNKIN